MKGKLNTLNIKVLFSVTLKPQPRYTLHNTSTSLIGHLERVPGKQTNDGTFFYSSTSRPADTGARSFPTGVVPQGDVEHDIPLIPCDPRLAANEERTVGFIASHRYSNETALVNRCNQGSRIHSTRCSSPCSAAVAKHSAVIRHVPRAPILPGPSKNRADPSSRGHIRSRQSRAFVPGAAISPCPCHLARALVPRKSVVLFPSEGSEVVVCSRICTRAVAHGALILPRLLEECKMPLIRGFGHCLLIPGTPVFSRPLKDSNMPFSAVIQQALSF